MDGGRHEKRCNQLMKTHELGPNAHKASESISGLGAATVSSARSMARSEDEAYGYYVQRFRQYVAWALLWLRSLLSISSLACTIHRCASCNRP